MNVKAREILTVGIFQHFPTDSTERSLMMVCCMRTWHIAMKYYDYVARTFDMRHWKVSIEI